MTKGIAVIGDALTHGAVITTGSSTRFVDGKGVARIGDMVSCPQLGHGTNPIVGDPQTVFLEGRGVAMEGMSSACGATILPTGRPVFRGTSGGGGGSPAPVSLSEAEVEEVGVETEDMSPEERYSYASDRYGAANANSVVEQTTVQSRSDPGAIATPANTASSATVGCDGVTNSTPDSYAISRSFTVASVSSGAILPHRVPNATRLGLSRATVICNMKHLAQNSLEPFKAWLARSFPQYSMRIGSGFRNETNGSDHNRGSAADIYIYNGGSRVSREQIRVVAVRFVGANIPFTQFLLEYNSGSRGWIHLANKKSGVNSGLHVGYSLNNGANFHAGMPRRA